VDELIRSKMHEALDVEEPDLHLRSRVLASIPIDEPRARWSWKFSGQWAGGVVAALLAVAVVAGLLYEQGARSMLGPTTPPPLKLQAPEGIAIAPDGTVYVSDYPGNYVFRVEPNGGLAIVAGIGKYVYDPAHSGSPGLSGDGGPAIKANLANPSGLAVDRDGNLFISDSYRGTVRRIDSRGIITTIAGGGLTSLNFGDGGPATAAILQFPLGLALDAAGALYVGDTMASALGSTPRPDHRVRRIDPNGTITSLDTSALPGPGFAPGYLAVDGAGNLYVSDRAPIQSVNIVGGCRIVRVSKAGAVSVVAGTGTCGFSGDGHPAVAAQLDDPNGIAFDSAGNLYFSDSNNHRIRRIDQNGIITTVAGTGVAGFSGDDGPGTQAQLNHPFGIAMAPGNFLYIADGGNHRVRLLSLSDGIITTAAK
jgi:sugar lactone lactonase YvrE